MKNKLNLKNVASLLAVLFMVFGLVSCNRDDDNVDDLPQEEMTNVVLKVTDLENNTMTSYNYIIGAASQPVVKLTDGKSYEVETVFMNGNEDVTGEIREAKDEHFLTFNFPKSDITVTRKDPSSSTRTDGNRVGLITQWDVTKVVGSSSPLVNIVLVHEPKTVNEAKSGTTWGSVTGGETDADITFGLNN